MKVFAYTGRVIFRRDRGEEGNNFWSIRQLKPR
jgi:hypothetical protein